MESKEVFVKAHTRVIKQRVYRFVCKNCNQVVERTCYPSQPLYCLECRPQKATASKPNRKAIAQSKKKFTAQQPVAQEFIVQLDGTDHLSPKVQYAIELQSNTVKKSNF